MACLTTDLLAALGKLEPVFTPLVLAFRYWAKVSGAEEKKVPVFKETQAFSCTNM